MVRYFKRVYLNEVLSTFPSIYNSCDNISIIFIFKKLYF